MRTFGGGRGRFVAMGAAHDEQPIAEWERDESAAALVYGSILTGAAVVAASKIGHDPGMEIAYTTVTMLVVWIAHAYAAFIGVGARLEGGRVGRRLVRAGRDELPVLASVLPVIAAMAVSWAIGGGATATAFVGLSVSIAVMCALAARAARASGASTAGVLAAGGGALLLGALLIAAKVALK